MTRLSQLLLPTERQAPADAEAVSHRLMVRAGLVRQMGTGLWSWLPAGWRVHQRVVELIREEMEAIGSQEVLMPLLQPLSLWERTGRDADAGAEMFRLKDRKQSEMVLAISHEEAMTEHVAQVVRSYRDLPFSLFQFQLKERDEPRPRAGVLRTREFVMKDAYSFDRDVPGLLEHYERFREAYRRIYDRTGLRWYEVESDTGVMGGKLAHEYVAPCAAGEDDIVLAGGGTVYAANLEVAAADAQPVDWSGTDPAGDAPRAVTTPGRTTVAELTADLGRSAGTLLKAVPLVVAGAEPGRELVLVLVRGDHEVLELKAAKALGGTVRPANDEEIRAKIGPPGYLGPIGTAADVPVVLDAAVAAEVEADGATRGWIVGANRPDEHLDGVLPGRDFAYETADVRTVLDGDTVDGVPVTIEPAIEVGNIFQLMTRYSEPLGATYLDEDGQENAIVMGCYGIGPARIVAAAVEQFHDDRGICWPKAIAPFQIEVVSMGKPGGEELAAAEGVYAELRNAGFDVLLDDRAAGAGAKFADAELLGAPLRITVGKRSLAEGRVEVQIRRGQEDVEGGVPVDGLVAAVRDLWERVP